MKNETAKSSPTYDDLSPPAPNVDEMWRVYSNWLKADPVGKVPNEDEISLSELQAVLFFRSIVPLLEYLDENYMFGDHDLDCLATLAEDCNSISELEFFPDERRGFLFACITVFLEQYCVSNLLELLADAKDNGTIDVQMEIMNAISGEILAAMEDTVACNFDDDNDPGLAAAIALSLADMTAAKMSSSSSSSSSFKEGSNVGVLEEDDGGGKPAAKPRAIEKNDYSAGPSLGHKRKALDTPSEDNNDGSG
jgi:hypothetical protein